MKVYVFLGYFPDRESATAYTEPSYEPYPDADASDAEHDAREERNPIYPMRKDLDCYMDSDFIETITDGDMHAYLGSMLKESSQADSFKERLEKPNACMVLIFEEAIRGEELSFRDTEKLSYLGAFESSLK